MKPPNKGDGLGAAEAAGTVLNSDEAGWLPKRDGAAPAAPPKAGVLAPKSGAGVDWAGAPNNGALCAGVPKSPACK